MLKVEFRTGEIWGVSREFVGHYTGRPVVAMINLENMLAKGLRNYIEVARDELGIQPPYNVEIGVTGMRDVSLSLPNAGYTNQVSSPIFDEVLIHQVLMTDISPTAQRAVVQEFLRKLYDLAGETYQVETAAS